MNEKDLIAACIKGNPKAEKMLWERYSPVMFGVCRRYVKMQEDAEDVLVEAFYKVFSNLESFKGSGSFEGWIRRIVVNEALMFLRKRHNFNMVMEISKVDIASRMTIEDELAAQDIIKLLNQLPTGYRTVFNMYVLEGYKHREIAEILGISINTSKSQLILAKKRLQSLLRQSKYPGIDAADGA